MRSEGGQFKVTTNGENAYYPVGSIGGSVYFYGQNAFGNDYFENRTGSLPTVADGGAGRDTLIGSSMDDYLDGGDDMDYVYGMGGNDTLSASDLLTNYMYGGSGNDRIYGGYGDNYLFGEAGNDTLVGMSGRDYLSGGADNDYISGGDGDDSLFGGVGSDTLVGGVGNDFMYGNSGVDFLYGQLGDDTLDGGDDGNADYLNGGAGRDKFQMEGYGNRSSPFRFYVNLDDPADFGSTDDSFYGADTPARRVLLDRQRLSRSDIRQAVSRSGRPADDRMRLFGRRPCRCIHSPSEQSTVESGQLAG